MTSAQTRMNTKELSRFLPKIRIELHPTLNACWIWTSSSSGGYGTFHYRKKVAKPYRLAFEHWRGVIPPKHDIDHLCRVPLCVNPDHLEAVSHRENIMRGAARNVAAHHAGTCIYGHPRNDRNTFIRKSGRPMCRVCNRERMRKINKLN